MLPFNTERRGHLLNRLLHTWKTGNYPHVYCLYFSHLQIRRIGMKSIKLRRRVLWHSALILLLSVMFAGLGTRSSVAHADTSSFTRDISSSGVASFASAPSGTTDPVFPEISGVDDGQGEPAYAG